MVKPGSSTSGMASRADSMSSSSGTAANRSPTTMTTNPATLIFGWLSGRRSPLIVVKVLNPTMKNVVQTRALSTPCRVRPW